MQRDNPLILASIVFALGVGLVLCPFLYARYRPTHELPPANDATTPPEDVPVAQVTIDPDQLRIPALGIEAPVIYVDEKNESVYQKALQTGVVHYPDTAMPGQPGNVYIFGHSSDYVWTPGAYKTVFAKLPELQIGDEIELSDDQGQLYHYVVTDTKIVGPRDLSVLDQETNGKSLLTLQTSYPLGTALERYIVISELVK